MSKLNAVVFGGSGSLGKSLVSVLRRHESVNLVVNVGRHCNEDANYNIVLNEHQVFGQSEVSKVAAELNALGKFHAVYCVAGGWCGGNVSSVQLSENTREMLESSVETSLLAASVGSSIFQDVESPLLVLCGSKAAESGTPTMIAYGMAKAAVHHLARSIFSDPEAAGFPKKTRVRCIAPGVLNTEMNRSAMPEADTSSWTDLTELSNTLVSWLPEPTSDAESTSITDPVVLV